MKRPLLSTFFFIGMGAILLSLNLGVFNLRETSWKTFIIPGILIVLGLIALDSYIKKDRQGISLVWGMFAVLYGILITLGILDYFEFAYRDWLKLWPILFVAFGVHQLFKRPLQEKKKKIITINTSKNSEKKSFHSPDWELGPLQLTKNVAEYFFDFSKAIIPPGETPIQLTGFVGDIHMLIPEHIGAHITIKANVGAVELFDQLDKGLGADLVYETPNFETSEKRLRIFIKYNVVDVKIHGV
ncbi:hypothetical protein HMPREF1210_02653 [Paenisporosarcina sp. HGH0030]|uniref:cell wall-active antibiotics response protein LiaF n=1 Tax=Paenisporosarcina sp. HGH0030 TaxID=1078085 RepID=UPI00034E9181|nr:cell wall-active antibiotics response protein LiaF [Paenisporosarcina sp. HGH0030]EPD50683.1 hypothetical protein HMPREF1210_02653 [Paenisporosarcina sp. HGH0030]